MRWRTRGGPSAGTRCGCSRRTGTPACPGMRRRGDDPDGFMSMPEVVELHRRLRQRRSTRRCRPARRSPGSRPTDGGYAVATDRGDVATARRVVLASGACQRRHRAGARRGRARRRSTMVTPLTYRSPAQLADGGVLVVGAFGHRRPARRRDPPQRAPGHARRRRARAPAADLPRARHLLVAGRRRACSTSATTRSTTSSAPATSRRPS